MDNAVMGTIVALVAVIQLVGLVAAFAWVWWTELRPRQVLRARVAESRGKTRRGC